MKARLLALLCAVTLVAASSSCYNLHHTVGNGPIGQSEESATQWYAFWGLLPLGTVDSAELAAGATDYHVETKQSFGDIVINFFTSFVTIYSRTIIVTT